MLPTELSKSSLPIAYFTGVTCRFWAYITESFPPISKFLDGVSHLAMSPVWLVEHLLNRVMSLIDRATPLKTSIPFNITGKVAAGSGLTWDKLNHTFNFVQNMTESWEK